MALHGWCGQPGAAGYVMPPSQDANARRPAKKGRRSFLKKRTKRLFFVAVADVAGGTNT
jgi:hypothetical protein